MYWRLVPWGRPGGGGGSQRMGGGMAGWEDGWEDRSIGGGCEVGRLGRMGRMGGWADGRMDVRMG